MLINNKNFNNTLNLIDKNLSQEELLALLDKGNDFEKQIAALKINTLENSEQALILSKNLIGHDGKIREAAALKISELINEYKNLFKDKTIYTIFLKALIDVNSNVCRNILSSISALKTDKNFTDFFVPQLITQTNEMIHIVEKFNFQDGKYKVNKEVFKLYWYLEGIYELSEYIETNSIKEIVMKTKNIDEYTIREKTAKILSKKYYDEECEEIKKELKNDKNYYVRRF